MMIHKITLHSVDFNQWLKRLDTQLNRSTNKNSLKVPKVPKPTNGKYLFECTVPVYRFPLCQTVQDRHLARIQLFHQPHGIHGREKAARTSGT